MEDIFDTRTPERKRYEQKMERRRRTAAQGKCEKCHNCLPMNLPDPERKVCQSCLDKEAAQLLASRIEYREIESDDDALWQIEQVIRSGDTRSALMALVAYLRGKQG